MNKIDHFQFRHFLHNVCSSSDGKKNKVSDSLIELQTNEIGFIFFRRLLLFQTPSLTLCFYSKNEKKIIFHSYRNWIWKSHNSSKISDFSLYLYHSTLYLSIIYLVCSNSYFKFQHLRTKENLYFVVHWIKIK